MIKIFLFLTTTLFSVCLGRKHSTYVKYQWNYLNFTWPSTEAYLGSLNDNSYILENNVIANIEVWKDRMYLSLPRFKSGAPATLVSLPLKPTDGDTSPLLEPFPNWEMQKLDDCSAFQYVQSMEIDTQGRMWVLENGRTEVFNPNPRTKCPAKLVIIDLENNNEILLDYEFPDDVVYRGSVFLNDIVLDHEDGGYAYITDSDTEFPGIIVFSLRSKISWKVTHESMEGLEVASDMTVNGTNLNFFGSVDGIALSPASTEGDRVLYYAPLASYKMYSLPVNQLKNDDLQDVTEVGEKSGQSDGMFITNSGNLFFGLVTGDTVAIWNTDVPFKENTYFRNRDINQWPNAFDTDDQGFIYWISSRMQRFKISQVNIKEPNYRVIASIINEKSYQYYQDGSAPIFPEIN